MGVRITKGKRIIDLLIDDLERGNIMAINKAGAGTVVDVKGDIRKVWNIKLSDLSENSSHGIKRSTASINRPKSTLTVPHKPFNLIYFRARQPKRGDGVTYEMQKGIKASRKHAFILKLTQVSTKNADDNDNRSLVFERFGPKVPSKRNYKNGKPIMLQQIRAVRTQSIAQLFLGRRGGNLTTFVKDSFGNRYQVELIRASKYLRGKK